MLFRLVLIDAPGPISIKYTARSGSTCSPQLAGDFFLVFDGWDRFLLPRNAHFEKGVSVRMCVIVESNFAYHRLASPKP